MWEPGRICRHCPKGQRQELATHSGCFHSRPGLPGTQRDDPTLPPSGSSLRLRHWPPTPLSPLGSRHGSACLLEGSRWVGTVGARVALATISLSPITWQMPGLGPTEGQGFTQVHRNVCSLNTQPALGGVTGCRNCEVRLRFPNAVRRRGLICDIFTRN